MKTSKVNYFTMVRNNLTQVGQIANMEIIDVKLANLKTPVYVGDTPKDLESSLEAKVEFIYASYGFQHVNWDKKISKLEELLEVL